MKREMVREEVRSGMYIEHGIDSVVIEAFDEGCGRRVELGQMVESNGRIFAPKGTKGIVVGLSRPFSDGKTTNVIKVWFEGFGQSHQMKFKDLDL